MRTFILYCLSLLMLAGPCSTKPCKAANGTMTTAFCLANATVSALNVKKLVRKESGKKISLAGILTGGFQTAYGAFMIQEYNLNYSGVNNNDNGKTLGQVNMAVGACTMACSILNIALNRKPKAASTTFNTQLVDKHLVLGVCYRRSF